MPDRICRFCGTGLRLLLCDLGMQPLANAFVPSDSLSQTESFYPLQAFVCESCFLVQVPQFETPDTMFKEYPYFSSLSSTWLVAAKAYAGKMINYLSLDADSFVVEIGSNDGYLLRHFVERGVRVLGIDPARNCAKAASKVGVETLVAFFCKESARALRAKGRAADLIVANNVLAHTPRLNDFVAGIAELLAPGGVATIEVPHLLKLIQRTEYDTIYHEHFSYFSLGTAHRIFAAHGLDVVDVEELTSHGGSIRMWVRQSGSADVAPGVDQLIQFERDQGLLSLDTYKNFCNAVTESKLSLWEFLTVAKRSNKVTVAYGAAAKGNTLLNYCGVRSDMIPCVVDRSPHKQGTYMPGSHIPIVPVNHVTEIRPDYLLILPWNIANEIMSEMSYVRDWGCQFVVPVPRTVVL